MVNLPMSGNALIRDAAQRLGATSSTARLDAEVLLRYVLGLSRERLFLQWQQPVPHAAAARFDQLISRRLAGDPIAYLIGEREFMGLALVVNPGVLIPRPETEHMVEWALRWLVSRATATVADVGTGSGAIATALAVLLPNEWSGRVIASDLSSDALTIARTNLDRHDRRGRVAMVRGDLLTWCSGSLDLVVANLPYLRPDQVIGNPDLSAEPTLALVSGDDGLVAIRRLIADLPRLLTGNGAVALEIDPSQHSRVRDELVATLPTATLITLPDLAGHPRCVIAAFVPN